MQWAGLALTLADTSQAQDQAQGESAPANLPASPQREPLANPPQPINSTAADARQATDEQLVAGCRAGVAAMQRAFYDKYVARMTALCLRYSADRAEAEDVLHRAMLKGLRSMDRYRGGSLEGWLRRICVHESINAYHARRRRLGHEEAGADELPPSAVGSAPPEALAALGYQELLGLINTLPEGAKQVFCLYAIDGYDHAEIAQMLEVSVGTCKSQLWRARQLLQAKILPKTAPDTATKKPQGSKSLKT